MRLSQLRCFVTVAQLENMSRAAELLHLSQSSLSKNITTLEEELGIPLFQRQGRKLILNPAGARLLDYSTMVLRELDYALEDMRLLSAGTEARIRIGTVGCFEKLTACLQAFREEVPQTEFELSGNIESREPLDINEFDMLIYPDARKYEKFTGIPLYEEKYYLALPVQHPLASSPLIRAEMLAGMNIIFLRSGRNAEEYPYQICNALALRFASVCYADSRELHRQMIARGICAGFVPADSLAFYRDSAIRLIPIQDQRFSRRIMICFRKEKYLSETGRKFRDFVLRYFAIEEQL